MAEFRISTTGFQDGDPIPARFTCDGENKSPALAWTGLPDGTRSLALIADDPDAPVGTFTHWVIYNLPPMMSRLPEGIAAIPQPRTGGTQGMNNFRHSGYDGPCPPRGQDHRYFFKLYALDLEPDLPAGQTSPALQKLMENHILDQAQVMGRYHR
jgi:Raf kinase inhibitor-like YbhB/YbcL family protein